VARRPPYGQVRKCIRICRRFL